MQKSRFGRTVIDGKIRLGGKLGPMLTLIWLVREQFGGERFKMTRVVGPKSVPRAPKSSQERQKVGYVFLNWLYLVVSGLYVGCMWVVSGCGGR